MAEDYSKKQLKYHKEIEAQKVQIFEGKKHIEQLNEQLRALEKPSASFLNTHHSLESIKEDSSVSFKPHDIGIGLIDASKVNESEVKRLRQEISGLKQNLFDTEQSANMKQLTIEKMNVDFQYQDSKLATMFEQHNNLRTINESLNYKIMKQKHQLEQMMSGLISKVEVPILLSDGYFPSNRQAKSR